MSPQLGTRTATPSRPLRILVTLLALALSAAVAPSALAPAEAEEAKPSGDHSFAPTSAAIPSAKVALKRAQSLTEGTTEELDVTLTLRDLALRVDRLRGADRRAAEAILARPNGGTTGVDNQLGATWPGIEAGKRCALDLPICVHWTETSKHAPSDADRNDNDVPDQVDRTLAEAKFVWRKVVNKYNYRRPIPDIHSSIDDDNDFDLYLSDIGSKGIYGYCVPDDNARQRDYRFADRAAYCVVDDDFSRTQFRANTPLQNLQVTVAHEFFHAVQFSYDASEDAWIMEATAAWIEDEIYDNVNDNRQYLANSPLRQPSKPVDRASGIAIYGSWIYFRYLSERYGRDIVHRIWRRADGTQGAPDDYSLQAISRALKAEGKNADAVMGNFAAANRYPQKHYSEGSHYRAVRVARRELTAAKRSTGWLGRRLDHLSSTAFAVRPTRNTPNSARALIKVDGPSRTTSPQARVLVQFRGGGVQSKAIRLGRSGDGATTIAFGRRVVAATVVLVNASDRFKRCGSKWTQYSCRGGIPVDDNKAYWTKISLR